MNPDVNDDLLSTDAMTDFDPMAGPATPMVDGEPGRGRLVLLRGGVDTDEAFEFTAPAIIGRFDPTVGPIDVDLGALQPEGTYVSRRHAKITHDGGVWLVEDLGSSNGTFLLADDFVRVEEPTEIVDGSELAFGNARFVFRTS